VIWEFDPTSNSPFRHPGPSGGCHGICPPLWGTFEAETFSVDTRVAAMMAEQSGGPAGAEFASAAATARSTLPPTSTAPASVRAPALTAHLSTAATTGADASFLPIFPDALRADAGDPPAASAVAALEARSTLRPASSAPTSSLSMSHKAPRLAPPAAVADVSLLPVFPCGLRAAAGDPPAASTVAGADARCTVRTTSAASSSPLSKAPTNFPPTADAEVVDASLLPVFPHASHASEGAPPVAPGRFAATPVPTAPDETAGTLLPQSRPTAADTPYVACSSLCTNAGAPLSVVNYCILFMWICVRRPFMSLIVRLRGPFRSSAGVFFHS